MSYTLPSDEALLDAVLKLGVRTPRDERRAVARLAIEHYIAEAVQASGVDVEALALRLCPVLTLDWNSGPRADLADAIRTAIAQAVARLSPPPSAAAPDAPR